MKLRINNLGVINECVIETKPLTVFCGPNNSGKTYLSYLLYGVKSNDYYVDLSDMNIDLNELNNDKFSIDLNSLTKSKSVVDSIEDEFKGDLDQFFNFTTDFFKNTTIELLNLNINNRGNTQYSIRSDGTTRMECTRVDNRLDIEVLELYSDEDRDFLLERILEFYIERECFILPSMRDGLNLVRVELNSNRSDIAESLVRERDSRDHRVSRYSKPVSDYLKFINAMEGVKSKVGPYSPLANKLAKLVGGTYSFDSSILTFTPYKSKIKLPLHMVSATVRSLAGLYFYLKYTSRIDTIVIDEPELNLHPENQVIFIRLIVEMVNSGIEVIVTTHSPYIMRELNNMFLLTKKIKGKASLMKKYGYSETNLLKNEDFVAYVVSDGVVDEMIKTDEGIQMDTFNNVIESLNDSFDDIYYSIEGESYE